MPDTTRPGSYPGLNNLQTRPLSGAIVLLAVLLTACTPNLEPAPRPVERAAPPAAAEPWLSMAAVHNDDWFHLLNRGEDAIEWRLRAIDSATRSIDLQSFIWELDAFGSQLRTRLLAAAERGVRVRVLIDDSFMLHDDSAIAALNAHPTIEYRLFNPYQRRSSSAATREVLNLGDFKRLDHRMHNKAMIVDNQVALIGGRNLADPYFGLHEKANFRDLELIIGGSIVPTLSEGFDRYWNSYWALPAETLLDATPVSAAGGGLAAAESAVNRDARWLALAAAAAPGTANLLLDEPPGRNPNAPGEAPVQVEAELIKLFDSASEEIWIVSAYLIPTQQLERAIERAEARGVQVRILTNSIRSNNHVTAHSAYREHINELIGHGADLHEVRADAKDRQRYMRSPVEDKLLALHAKLVVIDTDRVFVGSANLDPRSLRINTEMGLIIDSPVLNRQIRDAVAPDFSRRNAWHLVPSDDGSVQWVSDDQTLNRQPATSFMQRLEDWFFGILPIEGEL